MVCGSSVPGRAAEKVLSVTTLNDTFDVKQALAGNRFRGLWRLMTGFRRRYAAATAALGLAALFKTSTYLLLRYFVDTYLVAAERPVPLPLLALGFVGVAVFEGAFTYASGRLAAQTAEGIAFRLRTYLYDHLQRLPFSYHDEAQTGDLISRSTSDVNSIRRFFSDQAIGAGRILLLFLVNLGALAALDLRLAAVSIVVIPLIVVISLFFFRRVSDMYEAYQEQEATLSTTLQENLSGVRVVKAFARQGFEIDRFQEENWEKFQRGRRFIFMHSLFWPLTDILLAGQLLTGYYIAGRMTIAGQITLGTYLAYAGILIWLIWPMRNMGRLIVQMSTGLVSYGRVMDIVRADRERTDQGRSHPKSDLHGELVFEDVGFAYADHEPVLRGISFRAAPGQTIALLGSTGSGKTTLVNLLPRFYDYTDGQIKLDGVELSEYAPSHLRNVIGMVEQEPFLFSRSIRENITYGIEGHVSDERIEAAARSAAIHDVILTFPEGYETLVGEKGVTLSGGQKQRLAIARTLLRDPKILILDDATSSVDTETEADIRAALRRLMRGRTSLVIAHRVQSVMNADLILVLDQGRVVERGTHRDLIAQDGLYRRIFELQARVETELEKDMSHVDG